MLQIRQATEKDYEEVARIGKQCWELHKEKMPDIFNYEYYLEDKSTFNWLIQQPYRYVLVASDLDVATMDVITPIIGFVIIANSNDKDMVFEDICIDEAYRESGYGWMLTKATFELMKQMVPTLETWECTIYGFNHPCLNLANKLGCNLISTTSIYEFPD